MAPYARVLVEQRSGLLKNTGEDEGRRRYLRRCGEDGGVERETETEREKMKEHAAGVSGCVSSAAPKNLTLSVPPAYPVALRQQSGSSTNKHALVQQPLPPVRSSHTPQKPRGVAEAFISSSQRHSTPHSRPSGPSALAAGRAEHEGGAGCPNQGCQLATTEGDMGRGVRAV